MARIARNLKIQRQRSGSAKADGISWKECPNSWDVGFQIDLKPPDTAMNRIGMLMQKNKMDRRIKFGRAGGMNLLTARRLAKQRLGEIDQGRDPLVEKYQKRHALAITDLCDKYVGDMDAAAFSITASPKRLQQSTMTRAG